MNDILHFHCQETAETANICKQGTANVYYPMQYQGYYVDVVYVLGISNISHWRLIQQILTHVLSYQLLYHSLSGT